MDYKKILKGVIDIINTTKKSDIGFANICSYIGENCPELKDSEDEMIRKELITHCRNTRCVTEEGAERIAKWISWLEKQGEKPADKKEPKFKVGNTIKYVGERKELAADKYTIKEICNDCYITTCGSKIPFRMQEYYTIVNDVKKLKEIEASLPSFDEQQGTPVVAYNKEHCQNAAWSEEDEKMFDKTLYLLDAGFNNFKCTDGISECKVWLQSIKQRATWKPSDKQIRVLRWVLNNIPYNTHKEEISGLLEQLKKL